MAAVFSSLAVTRPAAADPLMTTVAGNGRADTIDGVATSASFLVPSAIAVAPDRSIYVADAGAQNIRRVHDGRVETIAGKSERGAATDDRTGGYLDGPAKIARFSRPLGLALAHDGTLYIADSGNDCIRKLYRGYVTTYAGSRTRGDADGPAGSATFQNIRAIALDDDGNLYVADEGVGIRKIDTTGIVTTLILPGLDRKIAAVAARGDAAHLILAYADDATVHVMAGGVNRALAVDDEREPLTSGLTIGYADALAIVNENTLLLCDVATNAVRLLRFPSPPFVTDQMTRALAGGIREGTDPAGGLADGPPGTALVSTPLGVALGPDGTIVVADAGNRRIRKITHVDFRESVLADLSNLNFARDAYNVAVVGNSYAFFNVLWNESIAGTIESGLNAAGRKSGLAKRAALTTFRIDDLGAAPQTSLIENELGDGQVDLIVLLANFYDPPDRKLLGDLEARLAQHHTKLLVVFTPQGFEISQLEFWKANVDEPDYRYADLRERAAREESYVQSLGARSLLLLDAMQREEARVDRRNFFYGADHHLTVYGAQWVGAQILGELERWRPWR